FIVDRHDIPGKNRVKVIIEDQPVFAEDQVNYIGEPILLVVGHDKTDILKILKEIRVAYEDIPPVLTLEEAEQSELFPIFGDDNCFVTYAHCHGDVDTAFKTAETIIENEYRTGYQEHIYLETQGVLATYEKSRVSVFGSIQCPFYVKNALISALGFESDRIRVVQTTVGGAFGGKEDYPSLIACQAAVAALKTGKPVQLLLDRLEDIEVTPKRHPSVIKIRTALNEHHRIIALEADIRLNAGAYMGLSNVVLQRAMFNIAGVYSVPNIRIKGRAVATNTVPNGAFRGFGAPQSIFAMEMHMDGVARELGLDPLEFKVNHMAKKGDLTATGGTFRHDIKLVELIAAVDTMSGYREKIKEFNTRKEGPYRGIGLAMVLHGCGFTGSGERDHIKARVKLRKLSHDRVEILVANVDMGQGLKTCLKKVVAKRLGLPMENIIYENPDTDRVPDSGPTVASRTTMIVGKLLANAAKRLKERWYEGGFIEVTESYKHPPEMQWDDTTFLGDAYPAYSWGVVAVEVEIDPVTYEIETKGTWAAFDIGTAIDRRIIRGQIEGGLLQGLGYGSLEVMQGKAGRVQQRSVTDYIIPTAMDAPKIASQLIDNPYDQGPFGAKGAGELTLVGGAPALAAAVGNALGIRIDRLPVTPEYLMEAVENGKAH
ncbi:MAG TPA: xanthine dehydrogenase family protein molybdopterin-binding subunit, partial [Bacillota bacterium]|nr:xanthine dehydrogenase family protein molybdopterin-binding subunit [Bacillota bacterium]